MAVVLTFTVTEAGFADKSHIPPSGIPGLTTSNQTLAAPNFAAQAEELRQKIRNLFLAIDPQADANTTVAITFTS